MRVAGAAAASLPSRNQLARMRMQQRQARSRTAPPRRTGRARCAARSCSASSTPSAALRPVTMSTTGRPTRSGAAVGLAVDAHDAGHAPAPRRRSRAARPADRRRRSPRRGTAPGAGSAATACRSRCPSFSMRAGLEVLDQHVGVGQQRQQRRRGRLGGRGRGASCACCGSGRGSRRPRRPLNGGPQVRVSSPCGGSTLSTSAPWSPRIWPQ